MYIRYRSYTYKLPATQRPTKGLACSQKSGSLSSTCVLFIMLWWNILICGLANFDEVECCVSTQCIGWCC